MIEGIVRCGWLKEDGKKQYVIKMVMSWLYSLYGVIFYSVYYGVVWKR